MKFILIIFIAGAGSGPGLELSPVYLSKADCEKAAIELFNDMKYTDGSKAPVPSYGRFVCIPK